MTSSGELPSASAVAQELGKVRAKNLSSLPRMNLSALTRCATAAALFRGRSQTPDIESLIRQGVSRLGGGSEQKALEDLLGLTPNLRLSLSADRRRRAATHLHVTAETFRKHKEVPLLLHLGEEIVQLADESLPDQEQAESKQKTKKTANKNTKTTKKKPWTLKSALKRFNKHPVITALVTILTIVCGAITIFQFVSPDDSPDKGATPIVVPIPYGNNPLPDSPTETNVVYVAGSRFASNSFENQGKAYCGHSISSTRDDAYLCVVPPDIDTTRIFMDPCFKVDDFSVVCAKAGKFGNYARFQVAAKLGQATATVPAGGWAAWPWQIVLMDDTVCEGRKGSALEFKGKVHIWDLAHQTIDSTPPLYICSKNSGRNSVADWWQLGSTEILTTLFTPVIPKSSDDGELGLVDSGKIWTAMYSPKQGTGFAKTKIKTAVY